MPGSNAPPGPGASSSSSRNVVRWISVSEVASVGGGGGGGRSLGRAGRGVAAAGTHPQDVSLFQRCLFMAELHESRLPVPQPVGLLTIEILLHVEHHHSSTAPGQVCFVFFFFAVLFCRFDFFLNFGLFFYFFSELFFLFLFFFSLSKFVSFFMFCRDSYVCTKL